MASGAVVGAGGGLTLCVSAASSCSSASLALHSFRDSRWLGFRLALPKRGVAGASVPSRHPFLSPVLVAFGKQTRREKCSMFHCASDVNMVTEDDMVDADGTEDEMDPDAAGNPDDGTEGAFPDEAASFECIKQQPLPYASDALEPYISKETVEQHWGVHQQMHVDRLNGMIGGSQWEGMSLGQMMLSSFNEGREQPHPPFFHAAQIWNHDFYWRSMKPDGGGKPPERLLKFINRDFGSYDGMIQQFMDAALTQFGSGWVWLSYKGSKLPYVNSKSPNPSDNYGRLVISKTPNAINPLVWGHSPLLAIDVWEHAYYLDYEDRRTDYVSAVLQKLVSWEMVESRLTKAVVRAVERDGPITRRQLRKQLLDRVKDQSRGRPRQGRTLMRRQGNQEVSSIRPLEA
uniref:superoxide dismutase n=1 Tax=Eleusine coracana TaxID=4511 RepID=A0A2C9PGL3_ELECO|nr:superoxide dismutase 1 [Eleusine coracana]